MCRSEPPAQSACVVCGRQPTAEQSRFMRTRPNPRRSSLCGASLLCIPLHPFPAAQNPGYEYVGQALHFCLSDLVWMKDVPARTCIARELGLDLGEQTFNAKGAGLHGRWSSRAQRLSCREQPSRRSRPRGLPVALTSASQGTRRMLPSCISAASPTAAPSHPCSR